MVLEFTVGNYRSFYEKKTFNMQSQGLSKEAKDNVFSALSYKLLKTAAIYGANSSGKSNLVKAMQTMSDCILNSVRLNDNDALLYVPFLLLKDITDPTLFEIIFLKDDFCFRYGFKYSLLRIEEEWLFRKTTPRSKEQVLFIRNNDGIGVNDKLFAEGSGLEEKTNDNRLFLSLCAQLGGSISKQVIAWFQQDLQILSGLNNQKYSNITKNSFFENKDICKRIICFFDKLQLGFNSIETIESEDSPESNRLSEQYIQYISKVNNRRNIELESTHNIYNKRGEICGSINFPFDERESAGTKKLFDIAGPVFEALDNGKTLVVDELDAKMHPLISQYIIDLFNNPKTNPYNAQLIFTTHDTHLLSLKLLRRDQIWFTEKDAKEQTDLYCLMDIVLPDGSKPRNDSNYERNYISGRYGAIPYIVND